jgi:YD repeat-containing protein
MRPVTRTLANGIKINWEYDAAGSSATMTLPDGRTIRAREDSKGNPISVEDSNGASLRVDRADHQTVVTSESAEGLQTATFSRRGEPASLAIKASELENSGVDIQVQGRARRIVLRNADNVVLSAETTVDERGRPMALQWRDSQGTHSISTERNGNETKVVTSWGEQQLAWHPHGQLASLARVRGGRTSVTKFAGGRPISVKDFDGTETTFSYDDKARTIQVEKSGSGPVKMGYSPDGRLTNAEVGSAYALEFKYDGNGRVVGVVQTPAW